MAAHRLTPVALALALGAAPALSQSLSQRVPLDAGPVAIPTLSAEATHAAPLGMRLTLKLVDEVQGRATAEGAVASRSGADLAELHALLEREGLLLSALIDISEERVAALLARAQARSGQTQPDLLGMLAVAVPGESPADLLRVGEALRALSVVEYVSVQALGCPPPGDIAPATPNLTANQGYHGPNPGINATAAWAQGLRGAGLRVSDCEYGWDFVHEEFIDVDLNLEPGQTIAPGVYVNNWDDHGTAVLGEMVAPDNGYGVSGLCPDVETATYPEWTVQGGFRRVAAIASAIADSDVGDIVLLEMQTVNFGSDYGPAELDPSVYNVVKAGVAAGVVVVGAAGNGNQNLDSGTYATYMGWGDSGAVIVGAGSNSTAHTKLSFSTYGSRVNLQGWGGSVFTTGYGSFAQYGGDEHQSYTSGFNGTSSASPIVTAACALVQNRSLVVNAAPLPPSILRQLLIDTGTPQNGGGHIGPLPELAAAIMAVGGFDPDPWVNLGQGKLGVQGVPVLAASGVLVPGSSYSIQVSQSAPLTFSWAVLGLTNLSLPFKGGTLVPSPDVLTGPNFTGFGGFMLLNGTWPVGIPASTEFYLQFWIPDGAASFGYSASNAVQGTAQ